MSRVVNVHAAKTHLSQILEEVQAGTEVVIAKAGRPVARLVPLDSSKRQLGFVRGKVGEAFFDPLPEEELRSWE